MATVSAPIHTAETTTLETVIINDIATLRELRTEWLELMQRSGTDEPMLSPLWLLPWWDIYGVTSGAELAVVALYQETRLIGLAPLLRRRFRYRPGLWFWRLELLGADVDEHDGVCSEYLHIIAELGYEKQVADELAKLISAQKFGVWHELVLPALDGENPLTETLATAFTEVGLHCDIETTTHAPYIALPDDWQTYLQDLGKQRRYVKKSLRDFASWAGDNATFHHATTEQELTEAKQILTSLHQQRWQNIGQDGVFAASRFANFHDIIMRDFFAKGNLHLHWLTVRGQAIAALYNFSWRGKMYFYQSGRVIDVPKNIRAGIVLHTHCIESAINNGSCEYDFLGGAARYKQQLATATRPIVQLRVTRFSWRETFRRYAQKCIRFLRSLRGM